MIWYRRDDMELEPELEPPARDEFLRELVDRLPEDLQLVVSLRFFGDMTLKRVAREMERTEAQVKGLLHEAYLQLQAMLEADRVGSVPPAD